MTRKIRARYANGVLTPDEPLDLEEGAVVELDIQTAPDHETNADKAKFQVIPNNSALMPGMEDPKKMKQLLEDEEIEHFLRVQEFGRGT
jgi:predicted DNA-binding antitoxin AbrB/MazE fold protein